MRTSHPSAIYGPAKRRAKWLVLGFGLATAVGSGSSAAAQAVHIVRLEVDPDHDIYRFVPARVTVRPGDVVHFRVSSGAPHNITFEGDRLPDAVRETLNAAMPNRTGDLAGPVLDRPGAEYRLVVPALPPGRYPFFCTPHRVYDMRGELIVVK